MRILQKKKIKKIKKKKIKKNVTIELERYTAGFFVYKMSEHCLVRNPCIAIRNKLDFNKMHA